MFVNRVKATSTSTPSASVPIFPPASTPPTRLVEAHRMNSQDQTQASLTTLATQIQDLEAQIKQNLAENAEEIIQCFMQEMEQEEEQNAQGTEENERQVNR